MSERLRVLVFDAAKLFNDFVRIKNAKRVASMSRAWGSRRSSELRASTTVMLGYHPCRIKEAHLP